MQICLQLLPGSQHIAYTLQIFGHPNQAPRPLGVLPTPEMLFPDGRTASSSAPVADPQPKTNVWRPRWAVARDNKAPKPTVAELPLKKPAPQQEKRQKLKKKKSKKSKKKHKSKAQFDMFDMFAVDNGDSSSGSGDTDNEEQEQTEGSVDMFSMFPTAKMPKNKKAKQKVKPKAVNFLRWSQPVLLEEKSKQQDDEPVLKLAPAKPKTDADKQLDIAAKAPPASAPVSVPQVCANPGPTEVPADDGLSNKQRQRR